jgi:hypothetical protein
MNAVRKFKRPESRKLYVYEGKKLIDIVHPYGGWFSHSKCCTTEQYTEIRKFVIENLYWLLGKDCDKETWKHEVDCWNIGKHIYGIDANKIPCSLFFDGEYEIALNSFEE